MRLKSVFASILIIFAVAFTACNRSSTANKSQIAYAVSGGTSSDDTVAKIEGVEIYEEQLIGNLSGQAKGQYLKAQTELYQQKKEALDTLVFERLVERFAKEKGKSSEEILKSEVEAKAAKVSDAEAKKMYDEVAAQSQGRQLPPFDAVKAQIISQLQAEKTNEAKEKFFNELSQKYKVTYFISPPRVEVATGDNPIKGNEKAPITIIEFSDFECPYCKKGYESINQVMKAYDGKVRLFFRDFPLSFHKNAKPAAVAVRCAGDQGKFWEYHDELFENQKDWALRADPSKKEAAADVEQKVEAKFTEIAKKLNLDAEKFKTCISSDTYSKKIDQDMEEGANAGVSGTPAFFINGIMLSGAQPFEAFKSVIDEELSRLESQKDKPQT